METYNLLGEKIYVCTKEEARALWNDDRSKRPFIWLEDEIAQCLLFDKDTLETIMNNKKQQPGYVYR